MFKRQKVNENIEDSAITWKTLKGFMNWKAKGSPSQILFDNKIYRKAGEIATLMNEYFISKVKNPQSTFKGQNIDLSGCYEAMDSKFYSLDLGYVSLKTVERIIRNLKSSKAVAVDELDSFR